LHNPTNLRIAILNVIHGQLSYNKVLLDMQEPNQFFLTTIEDLHPGRLSKTKILRPPHNLKTNEDVDNIHR
jgi:hypothetical protein